MILKVRFNGTIHKVVLNSRLSSVKELRKEVEVKTSIPPKLQRLFFKGKQLEDIYTVFDYDIQMNSYIEMAERVVMPEVIKFSKNNEDAKKEEDKENKEENDQQCTPSTSASTSASQGTTDEKILEPEKEKEKSELEKLKEIYDGDVKDLSEPEPVCKKCKGNDKKNCKECGCNSCGLKDNDAAQLLCDECEYYFHYYCVDLDGIPDGDWFCPECKNDADEIVQAGAKLKQKKSRLNAPSAKNTCKRDWGSGMATSGRKKECTKVPKNHFGAIPGIEVGMTWRYRIQLSEEGIHRPPVAGIAGRPDEGAFSIVLSGGYEGDVDNGDEFFYTGAGGRDLSGNKRTSEQAFDQTLTKTNLAIAKNCYGPVNDEVGHDSGDDWKKGKPVRVVRTYKLPSKYAPKEGCRYDGIYKVVKYWPEKGPSKLLIWRFMFRRDDDANPSPWSPKGLENIEKNGYECIWPEGTKELEEEKLAKKQREKLEKQNKNQKRKKMDEKPMPLCKKAKIDEHFKPNIVKKKVIYQIDPVIKEMIQKETKHKSDWTQILESEFNTKLEFTDRVETNFTCLICQYVIFKPITTRCGHSLCHQCYKNFLKHSESKNCPNCRSQLDEDDEIPNDLLSQILFKIYGEGYGNDR